MLSPTELFMPVKYKLQMRLEASSQLWFIRTPSRLSHGSTEGCVRSREGQGAAEGPRNRSSETNAYRCEVSSQAQSIAASAPRMIYSKLTAQKLKIKSNKSYSEELSQLMTTHFPTLRFNKESH